jgi:hypothetical protein
MAHPLEGLSYTFSDGVRLEVIQVKDTDPTLGDKRVFYYIHSLAGIPKKQVMPIAEFVSNYRHLFPNLEL